VIHTLIAMSECVLTAISNACEHSISAVRSASLPVQITLGVLQALASSIGSHVKVTVLSCKLSEHAHMFPSPGSVYGVLAQYGG
jgi:hypothetical protein